MWRKKVKRKKKKKKNEYFSLVPSKSNIDGMQWEERLDGEEPKRPRLLFVSEGSSRPPLAAATGVALFSHPAAIASLKTSAAEASCQESALNNA
ncbi:hypothetical protein T07_6531 [Trichinella nelsoni]|uniref:Uncharacterized protein n=1 Tax=Trichinella nelsoni TaxID=6336 RepID=A0A0V0RHV8_9BILA|nr:hypothetical protein T07_6531 [Trichinella nelsoni]KRZ87799.1 hypothetical protein T08_2184 [Trichinella sp. T8]